MDVGGGWEVVDGGGLGDVVLGGKDVPGGWEVFVGVVVDDMGGGVGEGADGEGDGIGFGEEVTDGNTEGDNDINDDNGGGGGGGGGLAAG